MKLWLRIYAVCGDSKRACERTDLHPNTIWRYVRALPWFKAEVDAIKEMWQELLAGGIANLRGKALAMVEHVMDRAMGEIEVDGVVLHNDKALSEGLKAATAILRSEGLLKDKVADRDPGAGGITIPIITQVVVTTPASRAVAARVVAKALPSIEGKVVSGYVVDEYDDDFGEEDTALDTQEG